MGPLNLHPDLIELQPVSIPRVHGLPPSVETTNDITIQDKPLLRHAFDLTQPALESLLRHLKPDLIFFDLQHWLPGLARRLRIKSVHYSVVSPASMGFLFTEGPITERSPPGYPPYMKSYKHVARDFHHIETVKEPGSGISIKQRLVTAIRESSAVGFRTCKEIEGRYCEFLEKKLKKPILLTGPIVPGPQSSAQDEKWADWLNKFKPKSVVFCSFGSEAVLSKAQFQELLLGFELAGFPFLIALRPPTSGSGSLEEALPDGFGQRTRDRGTVHVGWVPQQVILNHPSVGCFVTHCGYGSMWEGLMSGCRLVVLPHVADQYVQARLLSGDLKVAVEVEKGDEDGLFTKDGVCGAIRAVMADESGVGKEVRENHDKWRRFWLKEGFEDACFDKFVDNLYALLLK
ncbi:UDP-Glycosyltransferase superfamily protein [Striga asiatica]|uniref:Glycosyltransferase n=1 Tax=Striga asiatica TaxID=4170 RepID=A0A5A7Q8P9_STRAF|nr:UDP-Glycosyltransferase superfamily protein [Striga asiatica]